ncbi:MAG: CPBP family intramembrane metalloprotease [Clostridia bacterium]|nr:CPBP family intramembrane metalloprotease [Clostridia bacterium]
MASVLYGGIIEEVMMRLFFMSLITLVIWKLFFKKYDKENIPTSVFVIANVVAALAFAAGHLPATLVTFGELTPLILFRCFLFNGGFGLVFGWLYRKYGIVYAMAGHALFHIISKLIWFIFI